jgi:ferredoxin-NADP reductase
MTAKEGSRSLEGSRGSHAEVFHWQPLSDQVAIFRLKNVNGGAFPDYKAGQNIELYQGQKTMIFSIASAPHQTKKQGYLEFFISRDNFFCDGESLEYSAFASGDFTLDRTHGFDNVIFVATGTGIAPFVSMIRELSLSGKNQNVRYTLIHGSRKAVELGYYKELSGLAASGKLDLLYIPTISRPSAGDWNEPPIGKGRAGNLLRRLLHLPCKGEAVLPDSLKAQDFENRLQSNSTIILACGSHDSIADIKTVAVEKKIRFEKEDW